MKPLEKLLLTGWLLFSVLSCAIAQQTLYYQEPDNTFRTALELFNKEKYAMAREKFLLVAEKYPEPGSLTKARAEYLAAVCGYELFNNNAEPPFEKFLFTNPVNSQQPLAALELGKLEYRKGNFHKAIQYFSLVDRRDLEENARDEFLFKLGYSYLKSNDAGQAETTLTAIRDRNSLYYSPATYFLSHIAYSRQKYDKALEGFEQLKDDPTFKHIVPYYQAQIYYLQNNFEALLNIGPGLLQTTNLKRGPEIARMLGEAEFKNKRYPQAIPYFDQYINKTRNPISRNDYYQLAYCCYKTAQWEKAIENFNKAINQPDSLSQNAFYHLGECYVKTGQKKFALNSFQSAYKEGGDFSIREDALFNYAKLTYELSYDPYNEAIKALKQYSKEYPDSKRAEEAQTYLVNLYLSTKNYKEALVSLENIRNKDNRLKEAFQRLNYFRGIEEFNDGHYSEAYEFFNKASDLTPDRNIQASSLYWMGECQYRQGKYALSEELMKQFQLTPGAATQDVFPLADYTTGYCHFKTKTYDKAILAFRKLLTNPDRLSVKIRNDAFLRTGDCYFITKNYPEAIQYYDRSVALKTNETDYAMYQKSLAQGASGEFRDKAETLAALIGTYTKSSFQPQARFELGLTWLTLNEEQKALQTFEGLMTTFPSSHYVKDAQLRTGLIYYNQGNNELALKTFKKVVGDYPGTPESKEALMSIRNIYVDINKVDDFFVYARNLPFSNVSDAEQDSITYLAAENQYMARDCNSASRGFGNYLEKFRQGIFRTQAHFYLAECQFRENQPEMALKSYLYVISEPCSRFTETALLNASSIYFSKKDYEKALNLYLQLKEAYEFPANLLSAQTGIMRCNFLLKKFQETIDACKELISNDNASNELITEAHLTQAKAAMELQKTALAQTEFELTYKSTKNEMGAEAKFHLAVIQFNQENYKETEKMIFEFINEFPSYDYWLARSFILLADVYIKLGNIVQAKQTLQSIIDNYEGPDLVEAAHEKLNTIIKNEKDEALKKEEESRKAKEKEEDLIKIEQEGINENK